MNRLILNRVLSSSRCGSIRGAHGNPGPPATLDELPIPHKPFQEEANKWAAKWNMQLIGGIVALASGFGLCLWEHVLEFKWALAPPSYRNRKIGTGIDGTVPS